MSFLKKTAGRKANLLTHNIEDARVTVQSAPKERSQRQWIARSKIAANWLAKFFLSRVAVWIWNNAGSIWDWLHSNVGPFL
ncbi:hypothetical protein A264_04942 [Pseudomonas syringae pv. actinidiae ICMP 19071]|nr:hypothetical protein A264_04942 [Pseudomonas syringae pv. actinidiae ICMP 19071]EPM79869.1 hypothetical protein A3SO_04956 [Pseudomonas syringae pv. actinidiae ICMP 19072]OSN68400.1 hypothetical protein BV349_01086 [Pseudomonas syringae pv. actinidiae]OSN78553.1 hypothetical protein BV351_01170 [Pseudomonas syringae pv. actinidiae]RMS01309.1 hypothetical protein ALP75_200066 [Pseudomonas syringae pv. actinidiae]